jgi:hypothetical protein
MLFLTRKCVQMTSLESKLEETFRDLKITYPQQESIKSFLTVLKKHDPATYEHCLRVGLMGVEVAQLLEMDPKAFLYPSLLHDVGKAIIDPDILRKTVGYSEKDHEQMMNHPSYTYRLLQGVHEFSAEVALRHHTYQKKPYPAELPKSKIPFNGETWKLIDKVARTVSLLDVYDAFTTRKNERSGVGLSEEETKKAMEMFVPDQKELTGRLYERGIFGGTSLSDKRPYTNQTQDIVELVTAQDRTLSLPERESRDVVSAFVLEPIPPKPGCTTRYQDLKESKALELFLKAAVNVGPHFNNLVQYLQKTGSSEQSYQFLHQAMLASKLNREGGKINQGMLEFMFPLVSAHVLYDSGSQGDPRDLFDKTKDVLQQTNAVDVNWLIETKILANRMSNVVHKYPVRKHDVGTVLDYYKKELEVERGRNNLNGIVHNRQFVEGYPDLRLFFEAFEKSSHDKFSDKAVEAYKQLYAMPGYKELGHGIVADFNAVSNYLALAYSHGKEIIN